MNSTVEPLEGNKVKLSVTVDEDEFDKELDAAFRRIAKEVRIPGFRPGKAPRRLLEARIGTEIAREQALRDGLPKFYGDAVKEHAVDAIAAPDIDVTDGQEEGPVSFDAVVEVRPVVTVEGYESLRVTLERPEATEDEIDEQIDRMRAVEAELAEVDRPAAHGDHVTVDIKGTVDDEEQDGLTAEDYLYEVGSGSIAPEVDDELVGAKVGDILDFAATHPDPDEEGELRFRILVKKVQEQVLPELTDEWASEASDFDTLAEMRDDLATRMASVRRAQAQSNLRERVGEALAGLVTDELPEALVESEMQNRLQGLLMRLQAQGIELEQYLAMTGSDEGALIEEMRETARASAKVDLALRAVATAEGIECSDEDLDAELEAVAERVGEKPAKVRKQFERNEQLPAVRSDIEKRLALDWLLEHVEIVDPDGEPIDRAVLEDDPDEPEAVDGVSGEATEPETTESDEDGA